MIKLRGFYVPAERVIAVLPVEMAITRRLRDVASYEGKILDLTYGKKTRSVILMDSGHVILSSMTPRSVVMRLWRRS